jgi:pimeloyl-ACP methyl ester carboxylesterase
MDTNRAIDLTTTLVDTPTDTRATAQPTMTRPRWLKHLAIGLVALAAIGATYEAIASRTDAATYPPAGRLVDIGSHSLYLECEGTGSPTVVMDAGLGGSSLDWLLVRSQLAAAARVCVFDRSGMGWSEPGPLPRTPGRNAEELHRLLEAAHVDGPYVLVAHSLAGKNARMFAAAYPDDVAGMVLVDARSERIDLDATSDEADGMNTAVRAQTTLFAIARRLGLVRLFGPSLLGSPNLSPDAALQLALRETEPNAIAATLDEGLSRSADDAVLAKSRLGDLPLVVLAAADSINNIEGWHGAQTTMAALSTKGRLIITEPSSHAIQFDAPGDIIDAVLSVLAQIRAPN